VARYQRATPMPRHAAGGASASVRDLAPVAAVCSMANGRSHGRQLVGQPAPWLKPTRPQSMQQNRRPTPPSTMAVALRPSAGTSATRSRSGFSGALRRVQPRPAGHRPSTCCRSQSLGIVRMRATALRSAWPLKPSPSPSSTWPRSDSIAFDYFPPLIQPRLENNPCAGLIRSRHAC